MDSSVATALAITVVGITLLFLTLVFFYGLMVLITTVLRDAETAPEHPAGDMRQEPGRQEVMLRAAAVAVAMARAEAKQGAGTPPTPVERTGTDPSPPSPWWAFHHQRRLGPDSRARRVP